MPTNFPGSLDAFNNPTGSDQLSSVTVPHADQHADANDAIEAIEAKVGVDNSTDHTSLDRRVCRSPFYPPFAVAGNSDEFDDGSLSGWTAVQDASPVLTLTEANDRLSILHPGGDSAAELHAWVKAQAFVANDWVEVAFCNVGIRQQYLILGLVFSDGTAYGAGNQVTFDVNVNDTSGTFSAPVVRIMTGFNALSSIPASAFISEANPLGILFLRFKYLGSNQWSGYVSPDGITWLEILSAVSATLTPTHAGFFVTTWGGAGKQAVSLLYCRFGNG